LKWWKEEGEWWYLQDNDPKHKSNKARDYFHNMGILCIDFPPYSPDLNPIENVWNMLKQNVNTHVDEYKDKGSKGPPTAQQYTECFKHEWKNFDTAKLQTLVNNMPARCLAVIASKGHKIKR
jgi:hypothetical protein